MSHRLVFALCAAIAWVSIAAIASSAAQAHPRHRAHYRACVVADYGTRLRIDRCHDYDCSERVRRGRAFRVVRQHGIYLLVWNLSVKGWVHIDALSLAPQAYCRAAGI